jgi:hypothetical protein
MNEAVSLEVLTELAGVARREERLLAEIDGAFAKMDQGTRSERAR